MMDAVDRKLPDRDFLVALLADCAEREQNNMERAARKGIEANAGAQAAVELVFDLADVLESGELGVAALCDLIPPSKKTVGERAS